MGFVPEWAYYVHAGKIAGVHPAILAGIPETMSCYAWSVWIVAWDSAVGEARTHKTPSS
jgi:hypothetical protein